MDSLIKKIKTLFDYRDFDHLYELGGLSNKDKEVLEQKLIRLQQDIYFLDEYLESNWELDRSELKSYWNRIHQSLSNLKVPAKLYDDYSSHIYKYQHHEEQLRQDVDMLRLSMEYFYFYKSCDVKLLRRIIYDYAPKLNKHYSLSDWRYFDLITEVNDDVDDLIEDLSTINGNRLLLLIRQKGIDVARKEFNDFMDVIAQKSTDRLALRGASYQYIHDRTIEQVVATKDMLEDRIKEYQSKQSVSA